MKIHDEADGLDVREADLKAKETQQTQQELEVVKVNIDTIVQEFEKQLNSTSPSDFNMLLKKSESAIASIIRAYQPPVDVPVDRTLHIPQIGERVLIKGMGNKLATVVEATSDDNTVLVQYGKIRVRLNINSINAVTDDNGATTSTLRSSRKVCFAWLLSLAMEHFVFSFLLILLLHLLSMSWAHQDDSELCIGKLFTTDHKIIVFFCKRECIRFCNLIILLTNYSCSLSITYVKIVDLYIKHTNQYEFLS